jgi:hypothetical protein
MRDRALSGIEPEGLRRCRQHRRQDQHYNEQK